MIAIKNKPQIELFSLFQEKFVKKVVTDVTYSKNHHIN